MENEQTLYRKNNMSFSEWVEINNGFAYYNSNLAKIFENFDLYYENNKVYVSYQNYLLLIMTIENSSIYLIKEEKKEDKLGDVFTKSAVQRKLLHEYEFAFRLDKAAERRRYKKSLRNDGHDEDSEIINGNGDYYLVDYNEYSFTTWEDADEFKLTQTNMFLLKRYLDKAKTKIDLGFERYNKLIIDQNLLDKTSYLKVYVDGAYSVDELNKLLEAYNRLYSVIQCVCDYGYEEIDAMDDISDILSRNSMVLEQISVACPGFFVSVLSGVASNLISHLIEAWLIGDDEKANKYKNEALEQARLTSPEVGDRVEVLFQRLERNMRRKKDGLLPQGSIDIEIQRDIEEIKRLQGIPTINKLI